MTDEVLLVRYVYAYLDPRPKDRRVYIGASIDPGRELTARWLRGGAPKRVQPWFDELHAAGLEPVLRIASTVIGTSHDIGVLEARYKKAAKRVLGERCLNINTDWFYPSLSTSIAAGKAMNASKTKRQREQGCTPAELRHCRELSRSKKRAERSAESLRRRRSTSGPTTKELAGYDKAKSKVTHEQRVERGKLGAHYIHHTRRNIVSATCPLCLGGTDRNG